MIKFQDELINTIESIPVECFPHSLLLCGRHGCGKHTLSKNIAQKLSAKYTEVSNADIKTTILLLPDIVECTLFVFNVWELSEVQVSFLLKTLEEPQSNVYIVILSEDESDIPRSIVNRCLTLKFREYDTVHLRTFIDKISGRGTMQYQFLEKLSRTPGDVIEYSSVNLEDMYNTSTFIYENISRASLPNTLNLLDKIAFQSEKGEFEPKLFMKMMRFVAYEYAMKKGGKRFFYAYKLAKEILAAMRDTRLNLRTLYINYLIKLWSIMRAC